MIAAVLLPMTISAQSYSDIININVLVSAMKSQSEGITPACARQLKSMGYKYKRPYVSNPSSMNGIYEVYYKNCTVDKYGNATSFSKGNTSIVYGGNISMRGSVITLTVFNRGAYNHVLQQLRQAGFTSHVGSDTMVDWTLQKGEIGVYITYPDAYQRTYSFIIGLV